MKKTGHRLACQGQQSSSRQTQKEKRVIPINAAAVSVSPKLQRPVWVPPFPHARRLHSLPISFPAPPHQVPAALQSPLPLPVPILDPLSSPTPSRSSVNPTCLGRLHAPQPAPRATSASPHPPCPHPAHSEPSAAPPRSLTPWTPSAPCPQSPSRCSAPAGPATPGRSRPLCPAHPLVTTNHSARICG